MPSTEGGSRPRWVRVAVVAVFCHTLFVGEGLMAQQVALPASPANPGLSQTPPAPVRIPPLPATPTTVSVQPAFSVILDPAHGGANTGARIAADSLEKDLTLAFAASLRGALVARGIPVAVTRDSDFDLPLDQRAGLMNHALASACLLIHATATGTGIHLFTSSLAHAVSPPSALVPWQTAQAAWVTRSLRLSSEINSALGQAGIPVTLGVASVQPLDNLACPAVAVEIAPLAASARNKAVPLSDRAYQQRIVDALTAAVLEWSADWKQQP